jgi:hypothetical protein
MPGLLRHHLFEQPGDLVTRFDIARQRALRKDAQGFLEYCSDLVTLEDFSVAQYLDEAGDERERALATGIRRDVGEQHDGLLFRVRRKS